VHEFSVVVRRANDEVIKAIVIDVASAGYLLSKILAWLVAVLNPIGLVFQPVWRAVKYHDAAKFNVSLAKTRRRYDHVSKAIAVEITGVSGMSAKHTELNLSTTNPVRA